MRTKIKQAVELAVALVVVVVGWCVIGVAASMLVAKIVELVGGQL